jgi:hypothetical protein
MAQHSTCLSPFCGYWADRYLATCPRCGRMMRPDDEIVGRGGHVVWCGLILIAAMGGVAWALGPKLLQALTDPLAPAAPRPTVLQAQLAIGLILLMFAGGVAFLLNGIVMVARARPMRWLTLAGISCIVLAALAALGFAATTLA